jgi:hypothetical protein
LPQAVRRPDEKRVLVGILVDYLSVDRMVKFNQLQVLGDPHVNILFAQVVRRLTAIIAALYDCRRVLGMLAALNFLDHPRHPVDAPSELKSELFVCFYSKVAHND